MEYITSRGFFLPETAEEMAEAFWFNMWQSKQWPYQKLREGDLLYWYETPSKSIVWKTQVAEADRFEYTDRNGAGSRLEERFGEFDKAQPYFANAPAKGFCLAYKVLPIQQTDLPKPDDIRFPQLGWLQPDEGMAAEWLSISRHEDKILDDYVSGGTILEKLRDLNTEMAGVLPSKVRAIVSQTIRRDTKLVRTLKSFYKYKCQFPDCDVMIPKHKGGWYAEVAHIKPVAKGGQSVLGNLLVLCPNHHKEFDYGDLKIAEQTVEVLRGSLNGKKFEIDLRLQSKDS